MDLESECSALESVEDNEVITPKKLPNLSGTSIDNNGYYPIEHDDNLSAERKADGGNEFTESVNSSPTTVQSPEVSIGLSPPAAAKGYGLKKWRRIRRDVNQEGGSSADSSKVLKRGLSNSKNSAPNLRRPIMKTLAKDSVFTPNNLAVGPSSAAGTDAVNREERVSNSSNVENAWHNKNKMRSVSVSGKNLGNSFQRVQQKGKGKLETSKKPRGERVKIEKENSHSSMESDPRSLNFVFMQAANSGTSNGRQSTNYDGENSDEAQGSEQPFREECGSSFREDVSQEDVGADLSWEIKEEKSENYGSSTGGDSLVDSVTMLESAQEALQKEIQKLREIGCEDTLVFDDSELNYANPQVDEPSSSDVLQLSEIRSNSPRSLESHMIILKQNVNILESKLEEAKATLEMKEAKVMELEAILNSSSRSPRKSTGLHIELQQGDDRDMETELESLFRQKIEAEVEYLAISRTIQKLRVATVGQMKLVLEDEESKATMLNRRAEMLETSCCGDIIDTDEVLELQKRVCKFTSCFVLQLMLLVVVVGLFVLQLSPHYEDVVPT